MIKNTVMSLATPLAATFLLGACAGEPSPSPSEMASSASPDETAIPATAPAGPPPMSGDPANNPDMSEVAAQVDRDGDGKMSKAEWDAQGLPSTSFNAFEKGRGYVTLKDYQENPAPPGIDLNEDGKVTVAEFKEFDKQMAAQMSGKGPPPPPPGQ